MATAIININKDVVNVFKTFSGAKDYIEKSGMNGLVTMPYSRLLIKQQMQAREFVAAVVSSEIISEILKDTTICLMDSNSPAGNLVEAVRVGKSVRVGKKGSVDFVLTETFRGSGKFILQTVDNSNCYGEEYISEDRFFNRYMNFFCIEQEEVHQEEEHQEEERQDYGLLSISFNGNSYRIKCNLIMDVTSSKAMQSYDIASKDIDVLGLRLVLMGKHDELYQTNFGEISGKIIIAGERPHVYFNKYILGSHCYGKGAFVKEKWINYDKSLMLKGFNPFTVGHLESSEYIFPLCPIGF